MVEDGARQQHFTHAKNGRAIDDQKAVEHFRAPADERDIRNVDQQEEQDAEAGQAMQHPGPLTFPAAIRQVLQGVDHSCSPWGSRLSFLGLAYRSFPTGNVALFR